MKSKNPDRSQGHAAGQDDRYIAPDLQKLKQAVLDDLEQAALQYARNGWPVFPCSLQKTPLTAHGHKDATIDPATIRRMFAVNGVAGIGVPTGPVSGIVVIDRDRKHGVDGIAACHALERELGPLPVTLQQRTGSGGDQLLFRYPEGADIRCSSSKVAPGVDVRGVGGYVVVPPSRNEVGLYEWMNDLPLADLPDTWLERLTTPARPERTSAPTITALSSTPYGRAALERECTLQALTEPGSRNDELNRTAFRIGQLVGGQELVESEAIAALEQAAVACGLPESEAAKTIASGMNKGKEHSRSAPAADAPAPVHRPLPAMVTAAVLMIQEMPEIVWIVPGLLAAGLVILAGGPKLGKSWLLYVLTAQLGRGGVVLGRFKATVTKSLYLALEGSPRRLKDRMTALCDRDPYLSDGLHNVTITTQWPRFDDEGGLELLEDYIASNVEDGLKLVIIDTLAKVAPKSKSKGLNAYENDSIVMGRIKSLADKYSVCIILVTHLSKFRPGKDPFESITGSMGQFGTADTALLLSRVRGEDKAQLLTTGRDIDGETYGMQWDYPGWTCTGVEDATQPQLSQARRAILDLLATATDPMTTKEISNSLAKNHNTTKTLLQKMEGDGILISMGARGWKCTSPTSPTSPMSPMSPMSPRGRGDRGDGVMGCSTAKRRMWMHNCGQWPDGCSSCAWREDDGCFLLSPAPF